MIWSDFSLFHQSPGNEGKESIDDQYGKSNINKEYKYNDTIADISSGSRKELVYVHCR